MKTFARKFLSVTLAAMMLLSMLPTVAFAADSSDEFYKVVHLDAGRKYFSPEYIELLIDNAADAGFNQVNLYLSDNQGFRFALADTIVTTDYGDYDLKPTFGDGYSDGSKYPDYSGKYLTQDEMDDIIAYANKAGIEIVPCINVPGHMGAILEEFPDFKYSTGSSYWSQTSDSSIDLDNEEAVAFALALTDKYAAYFADAGCKYYCVGADEYANDLSSMGFEGMGEDLYTKFVQFLNAAAEIVIGYGMTPRAFNDGFYYKDYSIDEEPNKNYEVYYWSAGWGGYDVAAASTIAAKGHNMINTNGDYYWILGGSKCTVDKAEQFDYTAFQGSTIEDPAGAMFCIWCDVANANGTDDGETVINDTADVIAAFGETLPVTEVKTVSAYNEEYDVTVTAEGVELAGVDVTAADVELEGVTHVKAWDINPYIGEDEPEDYEDEASVKVYVPSHWNTDNMGAFVLNKNGTISMISGTYEDHYYTFTMPHFSVGGIYDVAATAGDDDTAGGTITVGVGQTITDTITGEYSDTNCTIEHPDIVDVDFEVTDPYSEVNVECQDLINRNNTSWQTTNYYYEKDGSYYPVYAKRSRSGYSWSGYTYTYTWGYSTTSSSSDVTQIGTQTTKSTSDTVNITVYEQAGDSKVTNVSFTGKTVGTTTVTVDDVTYTVEVVVAPLTVEFWITNNQVTTDKGVSMQIQASAANTEKGVLVSDLIPATGVWDNKDMAYWKTTCLDNEHYQTKKSGVNQTLNGSDFKYIRYWEDAWEHSADGKEWTAVLSDDQIVAYYMQITEVTKEVETQVVDWGPLYGDNYNDSNYVIVDYAVKYESGERVPDAFPVNGQTLKFHCDTGTENIQFGNVVRDGNTGVYYRNLWSIRVIESIDYEVYMITVTPTADSAKEYLSSGANSEATGQENFYAGTEKVLWVDDEANLGDFADENLRYTSISGDVTYHVGGEPVITELEIYNRHGMLVTYYVRAKANEDALTVHYIDKTDLAGNVEFYTYNIAVKEGTLFSDQIALDKNKWKGNLVNGTVRNYFDKDQTVSADLSTLSQIGAQYLYTDYVCEEVKVSDNNKEVFLYYTFKPYVHLVLDFGAPVVISAADLSEKISDDIVADMFFSGTSSTKYGTLTDNGTTITYALKDVLNGTDFFTLVVKTNEYVNVTGDAAKQVAFRVYVHPATNVLYEETFMSQSGTGKSWAKANTDAVGVTQQDVPSSDSIPYGYDSNYATSTGTSGTTYTATVGSGELTKNLTVDFTGTGFDLIGTSSPETGYMYLVITGDATKAVIVDTSHSIRKLHQVPLAHVELNYGNYTATVFGSYREAIAAANTDTVELYDTEDQTVTVVPVADVEENETVSKIVIDGFRVYNEYTNTVFDAKEQGVTYENILGEGLSSVDDAGNISAGFAAYVDNKSGNYTVENYESSGGPQNEVYLEAGQSIAMKIEGASEAHVSLRSVEGDTIVAYVSDGVDAQGKGQVTSKTINHTTELYYAVTLSNGYLTVKNNSGDLLAVGNVKILKAANAQVLALGAEDWVNLFSLLDEEPVFSPETFDVEIGSVKLFSKKITTMTITASLDVEYLKVNGKKVKPVNSWMVKRGLADEYVFVVTKNSKRNADVSFDVVAYDATGMASDVYTIEE